MLDGFGLAPVCVELDLDSYEGDWRHVARFRGRSGWLTVVEARLLTRSDEWNTTLVAACDEWGNPVPSFMAPNLLACACSLPQPCSDYPPDELDHQIQTEKTELKRRWVREHNASLKQLAAETAASIDGLEAEAKYRINLRDADIAELRMRRRMPGLLSEDRATLSEVIRDLENEQDQIADTLAAARDELRSMVADQEREILRRMEIRVTTDVLYTVEWRSRTRWGGEVPSWQFKPAGSWAQEVSRLRSDLAQLGSRERDCQRSLEAALSKLETKKRNAHIADVRSTYSGLRRRSRRIERLINRIEGR